MELVSIALAANMASKMICQSAWFTSGHLDYSACLRACREHRT